MSIDRDPIFPAGTSVPPPDESPVPGVGLPRFAGDAPLTPPPAPALRAGFDLAVGPSWGAERVWGAPPARGLLIAFEGGDGVGKATQAALLRAALLRAGRPAEIHAAPDYAREPSGPLIRAHLRRSWGVSWPRPPRVDSEQEADAAVRQALFHVNRCGAAREILRALASGTCVLLDRWWASSVAFLMAAGLDPGWLEEASSVLPPPDCWVLIDEDPVRCAERRPPRDANEADLDLQRRVRSAYGDLFSREDSRGESTPGVAPRLRGTAFTICSHGASPEAVHGAVVDCLWIALGKRFPGALP